MNEEKRATFRKPLNKISSFNDFSFLDYNEKLSKFINFLYLFSLLLISFPFVTLPSKKGEHFE